jgi:hypothetical protein
LGDPWSAAEQFPRYTPSEDKAVEIFTKKCAPAQSEQYKSEQYNISTTYRTTPFDNDMGKSRRKDRTKDRANPIAKPVKPPTDPELAEIREKQILPIITDLTSPDSTKRSSAAVAVANIIEDTKCRKLLLREQIVRILLEQTITDSALESKSAGWGILRNLALEEEVDFSIHLYRQDILTAIQSTAQTVGDTLGIFQR